MHMDAMPQPEGCPKPKPAKLGRFRRAARWVRNNVRDLVFAGALPLLAACSGNGCKDPCYSYNDTTITLNRATDGRTARMPELERIPSSPLIDAPAIDLLNETHAISSGPLPPDSKATLIPEECTKAMGVDAYACSGSAYEDRGAYFKGKIFIRPYGEDVVAAATGKPNSWKELAHEMGHLQPGGESNEVIPELNEFEQTLMANVVFSKQGFHMDSMRLGYIYPGIDSSVYRMLPANKDAYTKYTRADILVLMKLLEHDGNFAAARGELARHASNGTLASEEQNAVEEYLFGHSGSSEAEEATSLADLSVRLKIAIAGYIYRNFGLAEALDYFAALSRRVSGEGIGYSIGLNGIACSLMGTATMVTGGLMGPSSECESHGATEFTSYADSLRLCCASAEELEGHIRFRKYVLAAEDQVCFGPGVVDGSGHGTMRVDGFPYQAIDVFRILQQHEIGIGDSCMDPISAPSEFAPPRITNPPQFYPYKGHYISGFQASLPR